MISVVLQSCGLKDVGIAIMSKLGECQTDRSIETTKSALAVKDEKKIKGEIRDVIRQITASVTFLLLLDCLCPLDILIYIGIGRSVRLKAGGQSY